MDWQANPTDDAIEAVIQHATSNAPYAARSSVPLRDTRTQLFVGNLPYRVRWQDLKDLFRKAGTVLRADVSLGPDNRSRGYGTVLLATAEDAGRAVDTFNGYSWQSRILEVRLDRQLQESDPLLATTTTSFPDDPDYTSFLSDPSSGRNLFVGNLPFHCQWQDLKDLFRRAGTITRADVILGPDGRSRGFGTVVFATESDAERALNMFNGYEFNGRVLNVHRDKYSDWKPETTPTSPATGSSSSLSSHSYPTQITLPPGYTLDFVSTSGPASPHDMSKYQQHQHSHDQQRHQHHQKQTQIDLQLQQQYQHRPEQQHQGQHQRHHHQQSRLYDSPSIRDIENLSTTLASTSILKPAASITTSTLFPDYPNFLPPSSSSTSTPATTITTKRPIPIPTYQPLSHTHAMSSGSDMSEIFSRLNSTMTSPASSVSKISRPQSQAQGQSHPYGQTPGQGQGQRARGQPFQTSSPHSVSSPVSASASPHPHPCPHSSPHHRSPSCHASSQCSSSYPASASSRPSSRPPSSMPSHHHHHPQRPGPISLPPPLLPSQVSVSIPLSPHPHTPLGMSVSVSVSPLVEYPGGFGHYGPYQQYQQQQQQQQQPFGQHMAATTPHGLSLMTPSMPSFTFLPSAIGSGSHPTPTGRGGAGDGSSGGHKHSRPKSQPLGRQMRIESDEDENTLQNSNASTSGRASSPPVSPSSSSTRQRHHRHHQNQQSYDTNMYMQPTQGQQSYHQNQSPRRGVGSGSSTQPTSSISNASSHPQPISMHINLTSVPGAFSPGVVMSPGTFYGRPGEAPTFINAAVGAPLTLRGGGSGEGNEERSAAQSQPQDQWYHQNQTHGSYFYAMSSPRRKSPTGKEPKGYFDPLYFPAGVNVGGYSPSVGRSTLVNEIMKDGRAQSLGVEVGEEGEGGGRGEEEETHISDDGDDQKDNDADGDDDDDDSEEDERNQEAHGPPASATEDGDRRRIFSGESSIARSQSLPVPPH